MKKSLIILSLVFCHIAYAQKDSSNNMTITGRNALYVQLGGLGLVSVNYERVFKQTPKIKYSYRIGIETAPVFINSSQTVIAVSELNTFFGKERNFLELGIGTTLAWSKERKNPGITLLPHIGYRFQKKKGGFFFKAASYPVVFLIYIEQQFSGLVHLWYWGGLSIGKSF